MQTHACALFAKGRLSRKSRRGITLTETLLAIAVGALVLIGSVYLYVSAQGNAKTEEANSQIQAIISGVRGLYGGNADFSDLSNADAGGARVFPPQMITASDANAQTNPIDPWGGAVTVGPDQIANDNTMFDLTFTNVPKESCAKLVATNTSGLGSSVQDVQVNGQAMTLPIQPSQAVTACGNDQNTVTWALR